MHVLDIGEDGLLSVLPHVRDAFDLARLASTCRVFHQMLRDRSVLARIAQVRFPDAAGSEDDDGGLPPVARSRAGGSDDDEALTSDEDDEEADHAAPPRPASNYKEFRLPPASKVGVDSLEVLAVMERVRALESNHIVFHLASLSMVDRSKALLNRYVGLMRRHPRLRLRIDSHCGVGAPPSIAPSHSEARACTVAQYVVRRGISVDRISASAWGMDVGRARRWPATKEFARCDIFLGLAPPPATEEDETLAAFPPGASSLPARPRYYEGIEPRIASIDRASLDADGEDESDGGGDSDSDSDGEGLALPAGMPAGLIGLLQQLQAPGAQGASIQLPGGHVVSAQQLLSSLLAGGGLGPSGEVDSDDDDGSDDGAAYGGALEGSDDDDDDDDDGDNDDGGAVDVD